MLKVAVFLSFFSGLVQAGEIRLADIGHLPPADVVFLGEVHDNPQHHRGQALAISAIRPKAAVFEMLTPEQAARITPARLKDEAALEKALGWNVSGWPDFSLYYPVFQALAETGARFYGAAKPRNEARKAFDNGAAKVFGAQASRFGLDRPLPPEQLQHRIDEQYEAHCQAMPREMMGGMVEAQRLRDAALAQAALKAYQQTGGPVVVITGNGHARKDWGAPALLHKAAPDLALLSVGFLETDAEADVDPQQPPYDLWVYTEPAPREDPCKAFQ